MWESGIISVRCSISIPSDGARLELITRQLAQLLYQVAKGFKYMHIVEVRKIALDSKPNNLMRKLYYDTTVPNYTIMDGICRPASALARPLWQDNRDVL
jgi:hypothetical protein